jgi:cellulose synthase/poly-beta-1,6-N-acetylglucosamine synthase-like glycosyltransferase
VRGLVGHSLGFRSEMLIEDTHTSIDMFRAGWTSRYVNEPGEQLSICTHQPNSIAWRIKQVTLIYTHTPLHCTTILHCYCYYANLLCTRAVCVVCVGDYHLYCGVYLLLRIADALYSSHLITPIRLKHHKQQVLRWHQGAVQLLFFKGLYFTSFGGKFPTIWHRLYSFDQATYYLQAIPGYMLLLMPIIYGEPSLIIHLL